MRTKALCAAALAVVAVVVALVLTHPAPRLAGTNDVGAQNYAVTVKRGERVCQTGERIPGSARVLQLYSGVFGKPGPPVRVTIDGTGGRGSVRLPGGYSDRVLRVPLPPRPRGPARICLENEGRNRLALAGQLANVGPLPPGLATTFDGDGPPTAFVLQALYYGKGEAGALSQAGAVFRRMGYANAAGSWTPWLALACLLAAAGLSLMTVLGAPGRRTLLCCAGVGALASAGWAFVTPVLQVPDEPQHFAYVQHLLESGSPPRVPGGAPFSAEESAVFEAVNFNAVVGNRLGRPPWTATENAAVAAAIDRRPGRENGGGFTNVSNNPPLYYAVQALPYAAVTLAGGNVLDRLLAMRLFSALLAGLAVAFAYLFLRELLPGSPGAWGPGALVLALQPVFGFVSGGLNNDAGLYATGAATLWLVTRALRRGLDSRTALGLGAAIGLGLLTKLTIIGLLPAAVVLAAGLLWRAGSGGRRPVLARLALGAAMAALPVAVFLFLNLVVWKTGLVQGDAAAVTATDAPATSVRGILVYLWEFYLPRLPFMENLVGAGYPLTNVWGRGFIGRFGWLDTPFPAGAYLAGGAILAAIVGAAAVTVLRNHRTLRARAWTAAALVAGLAGLVVVIGVAGYRYRLDTGGLVFEQARYLIAVGALYAGVVALAIKAAGPGWVRALGALVVVLAIGHELLAQLLVIGRFYG